MTADKISAGVYIDAVARFLETDLRPQVTDKALRFRTLIASNVLQSVAAELVYGGRLQDVERAGLQGLLESGGTLAELNAELVAEIRAGGADAARDAQVRKHLLETLSRRLAVVNPGFDTHMEIES